MHSLVTVKAFGSRTEAALAQGLLEAAGITAVIFADDAGGMYPPTIMPRVELKVTADNVGKARQVLASMQSGT